MTTFDARLKIGKSHELDVLQALIRRDWHAEFFGQSLLSERMMSYLRTVQTGVRWMPDIIAAKLVNGKNVIAFVDAKAGERYKETGNHDVETAALEAAERWIEFCNNRCPYLFVFANGTIATPADIRERCWDGPFVGNGSGTPFKLFPCENTRSFDSFFGSAVTEIH